ncbi:MAG: branched-chain amino acid transaminase [bacterium]
MVEPTKKVWMDGELVDWKDANVHIMTHSLHYGVGAFEGIRCYKLSNGKSAIFRLKRHIRRLFDGLKILTMESGYTQEEIMDACVETVRANGLPECYLRPIMYMGDGEMGLSAMNKTRTAIPVWKWGVYLGHGALEKGIRAKVSSFNRYHVNVGMVQGKIIGQYVTSILAKREALTSGYDEAVMLDTQGYVAECSGENIFGIRDGVIYTPPTHSPILPGVTRDTVITLARELDFNLREEKFTRDFLYLCDEVFLTGTAAEITPVREVDDRNIGSGKPGPITLRLQKAFFDVVKGDDERHARWLTVI